MKKCFKCGGTEIVKGKICISASEYFPEYFFKPDGLRLFAATLRAGAKLDTESYACLGCGAIWSQTDSVALKEFMQKHCKQANKAQT